MRVIQDALALNGTDSLFYVKFFTIHNSYKRWREYAYTLGHTSTMAHTMLR